MKNTKREIFLDELAARIGAHIFNVPCEADSQGGRKPVQFVYAGDKVSELLNAAEEDTLLVTNLSNPQLFRIAELMDIPGICLVNGAQPPGEMLELALRNGTAILVSDEGLFETCGRIYGCLFGYMRGEE